MLCWPHSLVTKNSLGLSFKARHIVMICCLASAMSRTIALSCLTIKRLVESFVISRTVFVIVSMLAPVSGYLIQARLPIPSDRWRLLNRQSQFVWTYKCGSPRGLYPLPHQTTTPAQLPASRSVEVKCKGVLGISGASHAPCLSAYHCVALVLGWLPTYRGRCQAGAETSLYRPHW